MTEKMTYQEILELWVRDFIQTMDEGYLSPGNRSGEEVPGVKIIFDGYGYNEETNDDDDENIMTFVVFIHKDSLSGKFPEHEETTFVPIHRPKEEVFINAIYDVQEDSITILPFEEFDYTELDIDFVYELIEAIHEEYD
jgi:hypothetical protein